MDGHAQLLRIFSADSRMGEKEKEMKMKKIMFIALVALSATLAHAQNLKWGITTAASLDTEMFASGTIYLVATTSGLPTTDWSAKDTFAVADLTGTIILSHAITDGAYFDSTGADSSVTTLSGTTYFYEAVINSDGSAFAITTTTKSLNMKDNTLGANMVWSASAFATYGGSSSIPEPTSALLLLVGGSMLALRRRRV